MRECSIPDANTHKREVVCRPKEQHLFCSAATPSLAVVARCSCTSLLTGTVAGQRRAGLVQAGCPSLPRCSVSGTVAHVEGAQRHDLLLVGAGPKDVVGVQGVDFWWCRAGMGVLFCCGHKITGSTHSLLFHK